MRGFIPGTRWKWKLYGIGLHAHLRKNKGPEKENDEEKVIKMTNRNKKESRPVFDTVIQTYSSMCDDKFKIRNKASNYRQISIPGVNKDIHYEFIDIPEKGKIEIGLHIEKIRKPQLERMVKDRIPDINRSVKNIMFDITLKRGDFRMDGQVDQELPSEDIAQIMIDLIDTTHDMISGYERKK